MVLGNGEKVKSIRPVLVVFIQGSRARTGALLRLVQSMTALIEPYWEWLSPLLNKASMTKSTGCDGKSRTNLKQWQGQAHSIFSDWGYPCIHSASIIPLYFTSQTHLFDHNARNRRLTTISPTNMLTKTIASDKDVMFYVEKRTALLELWKFIRDSFLLYIQRSVEGSLSTAEVSYTAEK